MVCKPTLKDFERFTEGMPERVMGAVISAVEAVVPPVLTAGFVAFGWQMGEWVAFGCPVVGR